MEIHEIEKKVEYNEKEKVFYVTNLVVYKYDPIEFVNLNQQVEAQIEGQKKQIEEGEQMKKSYGEYLPKAQEVAKETYEAAKKEREEALKKEQKKDGSK